jgi:predicted dithiol-disulfide oxidoreductase (DUF899 family)
MPSKNTSTANQGVTMSLPEVVSQAEWLIARNALSTKEKAMTHQRDELSA